MKRRQFLKGVFGSAVMAVVGPMMPAVPDIHEISNAVFWYKGGPVNMNHAQVSLVKWAKSRVPMKYWTSVSFKTKKFDLSRREGLALTIEYDANKLKALS